MERKLDFIFKLSFSLNSNSLKLFFSLGQLFILDIKDRNIFPSSLCVVRIMAIGIIPLSLRDRQCKYKQFHLYNVLPCHQQSVTFLSILTNIIWFLTIYLYFSHVFFGEYNTYILK